MQNNFLPSYHIKPEVEILKLSSLFIHRRLNKNKLARSSAIHQGEGEFANFLSFHFQLYNKLCVAESYNNFFPLLRWTFVSNYHGLPAKVRHESSARKWINESSSRKPWWKAFGQSLMDWRARSFEGIESRALWVAIHDSSIPITKDGWCQVLAKETMWVHPSAFVCVSTQCIRTKQVSFHNVESEPSTLHGKWQKFSFLLSSSVRFVCFYFCGIKQAVKHKTSWKRTPRILKLKSDR